MVKAGHTWHLHSFYEWDVQGKTVIHSGFGTTYTGTFSEDGKTLSGGWRPDEGTESSDGNTYDAIMIRIDEGA